MLFFKGMQEGLRWQMAHEPTLWHTSYLITSVYPEHSHFLTTDLGRQPFQDICLVLPFYNFPTFCPMKHFKSQFKALTWVE